MSLERMNEIYPPFDSVQKLRIDSIDPLNLEATLLGVYCRLELNSDRLYDQSFVLSNLTDLIKYIDAYDKIHPDYDSKKIIYDQLCQILKLLGSRINIQELK